MKPSNLLLVVLAGAAAVGFLLARRGPSQPSVPLVPTSPKTLASGTTLIKGEGYLPSRIRIEAVYEEFGETQYLLLGLEGEDAGRSFVISQAQLDQMMSLPANNEFYIRVQ